MIVQMNDNPVSVSVLKESQQNTEKLLKPNMTQSAMDETKKAFEQNIQNEFGNVNSHLTNNLVTNEIPNIVYNEDEKSNFF